jgi:putative phosphoribosyl transferase
MNMINRHSKAKFRILSYSGESFQNRWQAGEMLAYELADLKGKRAVVLGIPRGGIIVAQALAQGIDADLDIVLSRKLGTPGQTELAMGALAEDGEVFLNQYVIGQVHIPQTAIEQEKERQMAEIKRRSGLIRAFLPRIPLKGRIVIVTDDGIATGATMQVAVWAVRKENPRKLIVAVPVASDEAIERLAEDADEIVCLRLPSMFWAVGQFYRQFEQVTDAEVLDILKKEKERRERS